MTITGLALFCFFAAATIGFAVVVALAREIFRAAFALLGTLIGVAGLIATLGSPTVAALQILIYVGGVFTLFIFAILVTERPGVSIFRRHRAAALAALVGAALVAALLLAGVARSPALVRSAAAATITARQIGFSLLTDNLLTFEAVSVLLTAGLVAAVIVIRKELAE